MFILPIKDENPHPPGFKPKLTIALIIVNVIIFFFEVAVTGQFWEFSNQRAAMMFYDWGAVPNCITGGSTITSFTGQQLPCPEMSYISLISSMFMHGGLMHLGGNMLFLWIFGDNVEAKFGKIKFLGIYLIWGIVAGLTHIVFDPTSSIPAVGASGAISGVMGAYLIIFPRAKVLTVVLLFFFLRMMHISAKWILLYYLIVQNVFPVLIPGIFGTGGGVAFLAHIGGFVIGVATGYLYKKTHSSEYTYGTRYGWRGDR